MKISPLPRPGKAGLALVLAIGMGQQAVCAQNQVAAFRPGSTESAAAALSNGDDFTEEMPLMPVTWGQAFDKHAPLAFFSVASLAVGGILVAIRSENAAKINPRPYSPDRDMILALSAAGIGSLISGGAFWYYSRQEITASRRDAKLSLSPILDQGGGIAAKWRILFSFGG